MLCLSLPLVGLTAHTLAYADTSDDSAANLQLVMVFIAVVAGAAIAIATPLLIARRRRHRHMELLGVAALVWAAVVVGSGITTSNAQAKWAKEKNLRLESGYASDTLDAEAPPLPLMLWGGLLVAYVGLWAWTLLPAPVAKAGSPVSPPS